jgi:hypothetical protein
MNTARKRHPFRIIIVSVAMFRVALELSLGPAVGAMKSSHVPRNARFQSATGVPPVRSDFQ